MVPPRVLIVEDRQEWQETLSKHLHEEGFSVEIATSLAEAVDLLNKQLYHVAVIDVRLKDWDKTNFDGMTVLDELSNRAIEASTLAKIMISAFGTPDQLRQAFRGHHVFDFIMKDKFNASEFRSTVRDAFVKEVRMNPELSIDFDDGLSFDNMIAGVTRGNERLKRDDTDFARYVIEVEDLFRRLFHNKTRIVIGRVSSGHGKTGVVKVYPYSDDSHDEQVIVKFGDFREVDREFANYEQYVKGKIGARTTHVLELRRTPLLGGVVYALIGTPVERVVDFANYYSQSPIPAIAPVLDDLFKVTCANWYFDRGVVQHLRLDTQYADGLGLTHDKMLEALRAKFRSFMNQKILTFPELPGVHVANPVFAIKDRSLARPTFLCTTHGDLNANNILVDPEGHTWLIDYYHTGRGHILRDCVMLESVVKFVLLADGDLASRYALERALIEMRRFRDVDGLTLNVPGDAYQKAFEACRKLRQIARDLVQPSDDLSEYEIGLLYTTLNTQRFYSLPRTNRLHSLLAAGMLAEKLGLAAT